MDRNILWHLNKRQVQRRRALPMSAINSLVNSAVPVLLPLCHLLWFSTEIPVAFTICWFNMLGRLRQRTGRTATAQERQGWYLLMAWPRANHFPFLRLSFPLIICLVYLDARHFGAAGSPALCCGGTHMSLSSLLLSRFQQEPHPAQSWRQCWLGMACPGNWAAERDRLLVRQESVSAARGPDLKCLWRRSDADYAQWPICLSVRGNLILSPLDSIDLHSGDWFQGHKAYGWGCSCSWTRPDVIFFPLSLLETPLVVRSTGTVSADDPD